MPGSGRCQRWGCCQVQPSCKIAPCWEERGSPGDPRSVLPSLADGDALRYPWDGEIPKGFPHPQQQPLALSPPTTPAHSRRGVGGTRTTPACHPHEEPQASPVQAAPPSCPPWDPLSGAGRTKRRSWIHPPHASSAGRLSLSDVPSNTESTKWVCLKHWMFLVVPRSWKSLFNHCQGLGLHILRRRTARAKGVLGAKDFL